MHCMIYFLKCSGCRKGGKEEVEEEEEKVDFPFILSCLSLFCLSLPLHGSPICFFISPPYSNAQLLLWLQ